MILLANKQKISFNKPINLDLDSEGKTLGIKILDACKNLHSSVLNSAVLI